MHNVPINSSTGQTMLHWKKQLRTTQISISEQPGINDNLVLTQFWAGSEQSSMTIF
jgi:hypothetical protein